MTSARGASINVREALRGLPAFDSFCSVAKLHALVDELRDRSDFIVEVAGNSANGLPIHHVQHGKGAAKALFVGFPHCNEPIGGLTVYSLLSLLRHGAPELVAADVEWHVVPCIDPDGALLNEGWSQQAYTLPSYLRGFHKQELCDQVEMSFPIRYKGLAFDRPTVEAQVLLRLITEICPDFYHSLHNAWTGGAHFFLTRPLDTKYYQQLLDLLKEHGIPVNPSPPYGETCERYADGMYEMCTTRTIYDSLARITQSPQELMLHGGCSWDYLAEIKPDALTFVSELPYVKHPTDASRKSSGQSLRLLKLRTDADSKFVATVILEEWEKVSEDLDGASPFYKKIFSGIVAAKDSLLEGLPSWPTKTRDVLGNPAYSGIATESERQNEYMLRFYFFCNSYEFVRLLKCSRQTPAVLAAIKRLEAVFDQALADVMDNVRPEHFSLIAYQTLARVQLGSGLIVLNSVLEAKSNAATRVQ